MSNGNIVAKLRQAPTAEALHAEQQAVNKMLTLASLEQWSAEANYSTERESPSPLATPESVVTDARPESSSKAPTPKAKVKDVDKKPWELVPPDATHPYHVVLSEQLFLKMDWTWKRKGNKSAREYVMQVLEAAVNKAIKEAGE